MKYTFLLYPHQNVRYRQSLGLLAEQELRMTLAALGHACDVETSLMQYLTDSCVDLSQLPPRDVKLKYTDWGIADDCVFTGHPSADKCVVRDPRDAAPEKGEQFFQVALEHLCKQVTDAYQHL